MDTRQLLAVVLGVLLGGFLLAFPATAVRLRTVGRTPVGRRGPYGSEGTPPDWTLWLTRVVGLACLAFAGFLVVSR